MKYGLIGDPIEQSWSPVIHHLLCGMEYEKVNVTPSQLKQFMEQKDFLGINVTIPHKQAVIPYLDELDPSAEEIGAVNCIINHNGRLKGYNTDYLGLKKMLKNHQIDVSGKRAAVLGSGGASKAAVQAVKALGGTPLIVSRSGKDGCINYEQLVQQEEQFQILINATPVGMIPKPQSVPVDLSQFHHLTAVVDLVANPLRTSLQFEAKMRGIRYCGGFEMLVRQAYSADELFLNQKLDPSCVLTCMNQLLYERQNIVLIGMPTSGKSTIAKLYAKQTHRTLIEMDDLLVEKMGMSIPYAFKTKGEQYFRSEETALAESLIPGRCQVISTGGGIIKNKDNMKALSMNGLIVWIDRKPELLFGSESRPLSNTEAEVQKLYEERRKLYEQYADIVIENNSTIEDALKQLDTSITEREF